MRFAVALMLAAISGFVSLSYEIVLYRTFSYGLWGAAIAFPLLLGAYLLGIAVGARGSRVLCREDLTDTNLPLRAIAAFIFGSNVLAYLSTGGIAWLAGANVHFGVWLLLVVVVSALLGAQFPLIAHFGVKPDERAGQNVSFLYGANIVGSTLGSLITGVVVLDHVPLSWTTLGLFLLGTTASVALYSATNPEKRRRNAAIAGLIVVGVVGAGIRPALFDKFYERLLFKGEDGGRTFKTVVENKFGVITVDNNDDIYGGGIYDGGFNVFPGKRDNHTLRAYAISLFHPKPKRVLMVGLSSGSWATIVANNPEVEELVVIEINPGYLEILPAYEQRVPLLNSDKVKIIIDDGRRWLARNPEEKFDVVIANHSHHWRNLATNLLSKEYNDLVREHMNPGAVYLFNTTTSSRVYRTAFESWKHVQRFQSCAVVSDVELPPDRERWRKLLTEYTIWGEPVFGGESVELVDKILGHVEPHKLGPEEDQFEFFYETQADLWERVKDAEIITDDNMGTEWTELLEP